MSRAVIERGLQRGRSLAHRLAELYLGYANTYKAGLNSGTVQFVALDDCMTVQEAAAALGVTPRRVEQFVNTGDLRAQRIGARVLIVDRDSVQTYQEMRRPPARPSTAPSLLMRLLEAALPTLAVDPGPLDCWAWKVMQRDPPQMAALSEAISVVERHSQLATLERRVRKEHTLRRGRAHARDDDQKLMDCLTYVEYGPGWPTPAGVTPERPYSLDPAPPHPADRRPFSNATSPRFVSHWRDGILRPSWALGDDDSAF